MNKKNKAGKFLLNNNTYVIFLALFIVCCLISDKFFSVLNLRNIVLQQSASILVAVGMLMVILTGGIDLSVGSVMAVGSSLTAILASKYGVPWGMAIVVALLFGRWHFHGYAGSLSEFPGICSFSGCDDNRQRCRLHDYECNAGQPGQRHTEHSDVQGARISDYLDYDYSGHCFRGY